LGTVFFYIKKTLSAIKGVEFVSDRMSYIILRGRWFDIIVPIVHATTEDKINYKTDTFYEELDTAVYSEQQKQTPWPLVRERSIPTDRPPLVDEI
jgi:hypothetical protein